MPDLTAAEIDAMIARHPLPEGVGDAVLNRSELAEFFAVTPLTITAWCNAGLPALVRGGQGAEYQFSTAAAYAWKQARDRAEETRSAEAQAAIVAMRLELTGGSSGNSIEALDPKTRREIMAAQREQEIYQAHRHSLLRRADVREGFETIFILVRDVLEAAPDRVERETTIPSAAVNALVDVCDGLVDEIRRRIEAWFHARPVRPGVTRTDLFESER